MECGRVGGGGCEGDGRMEEEDARFNGVIKDRDSAYSYCPLVSKILDFFLQSGCGHGPGSETPTEGRRRDGEGVATAAGTFDSACVRVRRETLSGQVDCGLGDEYSTGANELLG